jgi:cyanophycinase
MLCCCLLALGQPPQSTGGPPKGSIILDGGGRQGAVFRERFLRLAGGPDAAVVLIPTGGELDVAPVAKVEEFWRKSYGLKSLTVLHAENREQADTEAFVAPLKRAKGVVLNSKRPAAVVELYSGTRVERELEALLLRGGVISSGSDGASMFGSLLLRGGPEGVDSVIAPGYDRGLGLIKNAAIDQQLFKKERAASLAEVVSGHPGVLGIGIDEGAGVVIEGNRLEVMGSAKVAIFDGKDHAGKPYELLSAGDRYDLGARSPTRVTAAKKAASRKGLAKGELLDYFPNQIRVESTRDLKSIIIRDDGTRNLIREIKAHNAPITALALATNLSWVATASQDQTIRVFTIRDGLEKVKFRTRDGKVTKLECLNSDRVIAATFENGTVREFEIPLARE